MCVTRLVDNSTIARPTERSAMKVSSVSPLNRGDQITWMDIKQVFRRIWRCVQVWRAMFKQSMVREVDRWCSYLEALIATPLWR
ncbi:hypothetical protein PVAP13_4NG015100 [Panicum virgatum]|uniref:Uncharacterized protein n=1 Tax=Panicum virgatum TaxID=38727 RepID=A0A8T0SWU0_PANVG|nr:hypothetical protein PVAP13_4NG015100 [Panicum virgatum]